MFIPAYIHTLDDLLAWRARETPAVVAHYQQSAAGGWQPVTWEQHAGSVLRIASALVRRGVKAGAVAGIMVPNGQIWEVFERACYCLGVAVVGLETYAPLAHRQYILDAAGITCLLTVDTALLEGLNLTSVPCVVGIQPGAGIHHRYEDLLKEEIEDLPDGPRGGDLAAIIFTSGTTGLPKGLRYSHDQVIEAVRMLLHTYPESGPDHRFLCWLPLPNLFQRMINLLALANAAPIYYVDNPQKMAVMLPDIRPTALAGVPRFFTKVHAGVVAAFDKPVLRKLLPWALATARTKKGGFQAKLADVVLKKIRQSLGGAMRVVVSGSAPCPVETVQFFHDMGVPLLEAYAMSESIIPNAANRLGDFRIGSVGKPLFGNQIKISEDGEILVRSRGLYLANVAGEKPETDAEGFYATGDLGHFDDDGYLYVDGRKNEQFKLSTGRWVSPTRVEAALRPCRGVQDLMALGAGKKGVLLVLCVAPDVVRNATWRERFMVEMLGAAEALTPYERPIGVLLLPRLFSLDAGELTPNLKMKRKVIAENLAGDLARLEQAIEKSSERSVTLWPPC